MTELKQVVLLSNEIFNQGGVERYSATLANAFADLGIPVHWIGLMPEIVRADYELNELVTTQILYPERPPAVQNVSQFTGLARKRAEELQTHRLALRSQGIEELGKILNSYGPETLVLAAQLHIMEHLRDSGFVYGRPDGPIVVAQYHGTVGAVPNDTRRMNRTYREADLCTVLTEGDAIALRAEGLPRVDFVPDPVSPLTRAFDSVKSDFPLAVSVGRLSPEKGHIRLVQAWPAVLESVPNAQLEIYGEGPCEGDLVDLIADLNLQGSIRLMGYTSEPHEVISRAQIHVLPSRHEGFGLVIAEAAQVGVPTVAFACSPGVEMLIGSGNERGALAENNNIDAFSEAIVSLLQDPELAAERGERAKDFVANFEPARIAQRWIEIYNELY